MAEVAKTPKKEETLDELKARIEVEAKAKAELELRAQIENEVRADLIAKEKAKADPTAAQPGPRYRVKEECYLADIHYPKERIGVEITYFGVPGYFLEPLNDEAKQAMEKSKLLGKDGKVTPAPNFIDEMTKIT